MTKSVSRVLVVAIALAAMLSVFNAATAQDYTPTNPTALRGSTFEPSPATANSGFLGFQDLNPIPSSDPAAAVAAQAGSGGTGGGLAITGAETDIALAVGIGLLAVGGTALVASRKRDE